MIIDDNFFGSLVDGGWGSRQQCYSVTLFCVVTHRIYYHITLSLSIHVGKYRYVH